MSAGGGGEVVAPGATVVGMLRLSLTQGLGPVLISRLLERFGSAERVCEASPAALAQVQGIGETKSRSIAEQLRSSGERAASELELAEALKVSIVVKGGEGYPPLLAALPDSPPILYVKGQLRPDDGDRYPVAIVGSRQCSAYGLEQAGRFASVLARSGLTVISGGARGIDSAAHRGALTAGGRTVAVLGCGLAQCYPPENAGLFEQIAAAGAVVSELPLNTAPQADNFPARNRIISGMSLGVLVIEAGEKSGALITAKLAAEEHGREVMAVPGRVDSATSRGALELLKSGGALLVTDPADVIAVLEAPAHHQFRGSHADRYPALPFEGVVETKSSVEGIALTDTQRRILEALGEPLGMDDLASATGLEPGALRREITLLEIQKRVVREGTRLARCRR